MARTKRKPKRPANSSVRWSFCRSVARKLARPTLLLVITATIAAAATVGLMRMDQWVQRDRAFGGPPRITLIDVPVDIEPQIHERLEPFATARWSDPKLCRRISQSLEAEPWVQDVVRIRRLPNRSVVIRCRYRDPFAMVQIQDGFVLVDESGVRLPGVYNYHPSYMLIQGVESPPPAPGEMWDIGPVRSGLDLIGLLEQEAFADQITAILVHNYHGRRDRTSAHLELATDRAGGRIIWGSAIGEEIEENVAAEKLELLRANYERFGRVDANRSVIDVSVLPDGAYVPT